MNTFSALIATLLALTTYASAQRATTIALDPAIDGILTVRATVAGHQGTFLFDSGGGFSNLSPEFAAAIGCHPWGQITGFRMTGQRLDMQRCDHVTYTLAGRSFPSNTVGVFDMSKLLPKGMGHIDGVIALDLFANEAFTLSYGGHFLRLLDAGALAHETNGLRPMPVHLVRDAEGFAFTIDLPVSTSDGIAWFEMDSGNTSNLILINKVLGPLFRLKTESTDVPSVALALEDGTPVTGAARVMDLILDGNLGSSFLSTHDVTVDVRHQTAYVRSNAPNTDINRH